MIQIEDVRKLKYVGNWYRPPARSVLMKMPKSEIIEYVALAFKNWHSTEEAMSRAIDYNKRLNRQDEVAMT